MVLAMRMGQAARASAAVGAVAWLIACPGQLEAPERFRFQVGAAPTPGAAGAGGGYPVPLPLCPVDVEETILRDRCSTALCHDRDGAELAGQLRLDGPDLLDQLFAPAVNEACLEAGYLLRVDSADPEGGGLLRALVESGGTSCARRMPPSGEPLTAYEIECLRRFLEHAVSERRGEGAP